MEFVDRQEEMRRLDRLVQDRRAGLAVLWGRRRVGKTRLLLEWAGKHGGLYTVADQSAADVQRRYLAEAMGARLKGFAEATYPDWRALLNRLAADARDQGWQGPVILDELPYLVLSSPELPSVLQRWLDHEARAAHLVVAVSGSSQRMMQGLVLDGSAPLYGRASEMIELKPLRAGYLAGALGLPSATNAVEHFAAWGGIPRYWELAERSGRDLDQAVDELVLDPLGPLHTEPDRLLLEETPPAHSLRPILDAIGMGCHRLTEIAARLGAPATSLSKPMARLLGLGLITRDIPFGDSEKAGKRALYRIWDPFFRFWFRVVAPHRALLAGASRSARLGLWRAGKDSLIADAWEDLCREAVARLPAGMLSGVQGWEPAKRFWRGEGPEWDVAALSIDRRHLLLGEVKWSTRKAEAGSCARAAEQLLRKGVPPVSGVSGLKVVRAVFVPAAPRGCGRSSDVEVIDAPTVLSVLK